MKLLISQMQLEHRLSVLLQLHLHSRLNNWLHWIGQMQLNDETRNFKVWRFDAPYIRYFMVYFSFPRSPFSVFTVISLLISDRFQMNRDRSIPEKHLFQSSFQGQGHTWITGIKFRANRIQSCQLCAYNIWEIPRATSTSGDIDHPHGPLSRYVKLWVAHAPGMPGMFSPPSTSKETAS